MTKILVDKEALGAVISALNGQPHEIRELIALRASKESGRLSLSDLLGQKNPIDQLEEDLHRIDSGNTALDDEDKLTTQDLIRLASIPTPPVWSGGGFLYPTETEELNSKTLWTRSVWVRENILLAASYERASHRRTGDFKVDALTCRRAIFDHISRGNFELMVKWLQELTDLYRQNNGIKGNQEHYEAEIASINSDLRRLRSEGHPMFASHGVGVIGFSPFRPNAPDFSVHLDWQIKQYRTVPDFGDDQCLPLLQFEEIQYYARIDQNGRVTYYALHDVPAVNTEDDEVSYKETLSFIGSGPVIPTSLVSHENFEKLHEVLASYAKYNVIRPRMQT